MRLTKAEKQALLEAAVSRLAGETDVEIDAEALEGAAAKLREALAKAREPRW